MPILQKDPSGCPFLILAPMEGLGDRTFRKSMSTIGGFDEAVTDFLRVPSNAHVKSLAREYLSDETFPIPLAAQLMGSDPDLMAQMAVEIEKRGAPRIDLNCGCPSKTVTGKGSGSSLLKSPDLLHQIARALVKAVNIPVTVKMRSGYEDTSLFKENLLAAQESGIKFITLHPRTKVEGYTPPARWDLIALAKSLLKIPLVGNGDILTVEDGVRMLKTTGCDALMIGRGSVINPFIFHEIRGYFSNKPYKSEWGDLRCFLEVYLREMPQSASAKTKVNKLKQLMGFIFKKNAQLLEQRNTILTSKHLDADAFLHFVTPFLQAFWNVTDRL